MRAERTKASALFCDFGVSGTTSKFENDSAKEMNEIKAESRNGDFIAILISLQVIYNGHQATLHYLLAL